MTKIARRESQQRIVDSILEILRNISADGISSGQADELSPLEIIVGSIKVIQMMGVDGNNTEVMDKVLNESRKIHDKASKEEHSKNISKHSFIDPFPSKSVH